MITLKDGTVLRNLEEQVLENKQQIALHWNVDRVLADFGIKVLGHLDNLNALYAVPTDNLNYGDAYLIGPSEPYDVWIWTRADENAGQPNPYWLNIGHIAIEGPQGPQGPQGIPGEEGKSTKWIAVSSLPSATGYNENDLALMTTNGNVYKCQIAANGVTKTWAYVTNIRGPQGIQGERGPQGIQGEQGPQGIQGPQGDVGGFINIWGLLSHSNQLPDPAALNNLTVAYLIGTTEPYDLYIQIGKSSATAVWTNTGPFNAATAISVNGIYQNIWNADTKLDKNTSVTQYNQLYAKSADGGESYLNVTKEVLGDAAVQRHNDGTIFVPATTELANAAISKYQADNNYLAKIATESGFIRVYTINTNGEQTITNLRTGGYGGENMNGRIAVYLDENLSLPVDAKPFHGTLPVCTPTKDYHAVPKKYVEDNFIAIPNGTSYGIYLIPYEVLTPGQPGTIGEPIRVEYGTSQNTLARRGSNGVLSVGPPTAADHAATKAYVDAIVSNTVSISFPDATNKVFTARALAYFSKEPSAFIGAVLKESNILSYIIVGYDAINSEFTIYNTSTKEYYITNQYTIN